MACLPAEVRLPKANIRDRTRNGGTLAAGSRCWADHLEDDMARGFVKRTQRKIASAAGTAAGRVQTVAIKAATSAATAAAQAAVDTVMRAIARELQQSRSGRGAMASRGQGGGAQQAMSGNRGGGRKMSRKRAAQRAGRV